MLLNFFVLVINLQNLATRVLLIIGILLFVSSIFFLCSLVLFINWIFGSNRSLNSVLGNYKRVFQC